MMAGARHILVSKPVSLRVRLRDEAKASPQPERFQVSHNCPTQKSKYSLFKCLDRIKIV